MPLIKLETSVKCSEKQKNNLVIGLSKICAECTGKPESYVLSIIEDGALISFGGKVKKGAFLEVKSIGGLNSSVNNSLTEKICDYLKKELDIAPSDVYINFSDVSGINWGWNGSTFG